MNRALTLWWDGEAVGRLIIDKTGNTSFAYLESWLAKKGARAISASLPLSTKSFSRRESRPFFEGLLPEESQRTAIAAVLVVSETNEFRLLEHLGGEVAGALSFWPEGETPPQATSYETRPPLSDDELIAILNRLPSRPLLVGEQGLRLSLAGAQAKVPVIVTKEGIALPVPDQPTTHILKPPIERFEDTTENEAFAMRLAQIIGLDVAHVKLSEVKGHEFLLVQRYDRVIDESGTIKRLHQEDFCQAMGYTSARKYASDGGPVFRDCFNLLRTVATRPAREVLKLLDAAIFNLIIGNADAHGKNFSLLYQPTGTVFAPLYDLLSTVAYPDISPRLAMKIAKRTSLEGLKAKDWGNFASEIGMTEPFVRQRAVELAMLARDKADVAAGGFDLPKTRRQAMQRFVELVSIRAERLLNI